MYVRSEFNLLHVHRNLYRRNPPPLVTLKDRPGTRNGSCIPKNVRNLCDRRTPVVVVVGRYMQLSVSTTGCSWCISPKLVHPVASKLGVAFRFGPDWHGTVDTYAVITEIYSYDGRAFSKMNECNMNEWIRSCQRTHRGVHGSIL